MAVRLYGERLLHLIIVLAAWRWLSTRCRCSGVRNLFNPKVWWQSIVVWFAVAVIGHDFVLFPLYTLADRLLPRQRGPHKDRPTSPQLSGRVPLTNYVRMPTLAAGLLLMLFLPGIINQGAPTYQAATGLTQAPYLSRWLLLTATFYLVSAICYAVKTLLVQRRTAGSAAAPPVVSTPPARPAAEADPGQA